RAHRQAPGRAGEIREPRRVDRTQHARPRDRTDPVGRAAHCCRAESGWRGARAGSAEPKHSATGASASKVSFLKVRERPGAAVRALLSRPWEWPVPNCTGHRSRSRTAATKSRKRTLEDSRHRLQIRRTVAWLLVDLLLLAFDVRLIDFLQPPVRRNFFHRQTPSLRRNAGRR